MKKVKIIVGAILRSALLAAPGVAFGWWASSKVQVFIAILAAIGLETLFLLAFSFIAVAAQVKRGEVVKEAPADED